MLNNALNRHFFGENYETLFEVVPLRTPYSVSISVGNVCDFKCTYCMAEELISTNKSEPYLITMPEFQEIARQLKEFPDPIRQVSFVSQGETILNKNLPKMIRQLKEEKIAEKVKIITNGNILTKEYADELLDAGLDVIKISIQGVSDEQYRQICRPSANFSFDRFYKQIEYIYNRRGTCKVYTKIIDVALQPGDEKKFYDLFRPISDYATVEKCIDINCDINKYGFELSQWDVCPTPFYYMCTDVWGNVFPCCVEAIKNSASNALGNLHDTTLYQLWNKEFKELQRDLLQQSLRPENGCFRCTAFRTVEKTKNMLDNHVKEILEKF